MIRTSEPEPIVPYGAVSRNRVGSALRTSSSGYLAPARVPEPLVYENAYTNPAERDAYDNYRPAAFGARRLSGYDVFYN